MRRNIERITYSSCLLLAVLLTLVGFQVGVVSAQNETDAAKADGSAPAATEPTEVQKRIDRARALAAAHQLASAAGELEAIKKTTNDEVIRNVTSVMLVGIYLEDGNYARTESLLEESFRVKPNDRDGSLRSYFAVAGQAVNGVRAHLARYRSFGINTGGENLPAEASGDLERLRSLLERMVAQANEITRERKAYDGLALLEDVLGLRLAVPRDADDRAKWENAYAVARENLASSQMQVASLGGLPSLRTTSPKNTPATEPDALAIAPPANSTAKPVNQSTPAAQTTASSSAPKVDENTAESEDTLRDRGLLNGLAMRKVPPIYPSLARNAGIGGVVRVYVIIDETGKVVKVTHTEGHLLLRPAAEEAARAWRFEPISFEGKPIKTKGYIEFNFTR